MAYGADARQFHSVALLEVATASNNGIEEAARKISRLLLQNGADPEDADPTSDVEELRRSKFMNTALSKNYESVREMSKWMLVAPNVTREDMPYSDEQQFKRVQNAINQGRQDRELILGMMGDIRWTNK